uniref:Uncharacterized protein n=1 Tax=Lactuca sativa TaxID=4236 RepID=A0A9R1XQH2_LACSA|nr:hypothetical protein LSAT_V11C300132650 [Lactuca sativa]
MKHYSARYSTNFRHDHIWSLVKKMDPNRQFTINLEDNEDTTRPIGVKVKLPSPPRHQVVDLHEILEKYVHDNKKNYECYQKYLEKKHLKIRKD